MSPPTVVSTFSGCGGSSLGYKLAGFDVRLAVEWDDNAVEAYRLNFPGTPVYHGDIAGLTVAQVCDNAGVEPGELDVLDGSPPCQGFSTAGRRKMDDDRNQLFREYVRLLRGLRPRAFIMENVSGMVKGKMRLIFAECMRELKASGYRVACRLMNAMYFGVPQSRERVIFVGVREDLGVEPSHPRAQTMPIPLRDVLPSLGGAGLAYKTGTGYVDIVATSARHPSPTATKTPNLTVVPKLDDAYGKLWDRVPIGGSAFDLLGKGQNSCVKPHPDRPSPTLPKTQTGRGFATIAHPLEARPLTIDEAKIIASFPPDFELVGTYQQQWARIGNSVPPLFMRAIAAHVREHVLGVIA